MLSAMQLREYIIVKTERYDYSVLTLPPDFLMYWDAMLYSVYTHCKMYSYV